MQAQAAYLLKPAEEEDEERPNPKSVFISAAREASSSSVSQPLPPSLSSASLLEAAAVRVPCGEAAGTARAAGAGG